MTVLLALESDLLGIGAARVLEGLPHAAVKVVDTLADALQAMRDASPRVIVASETLEPDTDVLWLLARLRQAAPATRIILIGRIQNGLLMRELLAQGASAYLYWYDPLQVCLPLAVTSALRGRNYLSPTANSEYIIAMASPEHVYDIDPEALRVLRLLAQGQHVSQIACALNINRRRVYWVRQKLRRRFGVLTNEHLISRAAAEGFIVVEG